MSNSSILRLNYIRGKIDTAPTYQRNSGIWDTDKRQLLIDSILNDFDIPKIYFHVLKKSRTLQDGRFARYAIIDGKQRIETIFNFLKDVFPLADDFLYYENPSIKAAGLKYSQLANKYPELKVNFDSYVLPIILVEADDIDLIEEMFSRLNEAVPLSSAEKRNAFGGPIPKVINNVASHEFFMIKVRFSDKRYQHREVAVRLLFLEKTISEQNRIIDTKKAFLDAFVKDYKNTANLQKTIPRELRNAVKSILNIMTEIFNNRDKLLGSQASVPIYYILFKYAIEQDCVKKITHTKLTEFSNKVKENRKLAEMNIAKADFDLLQFDRFSIQGTNDASSIKERARIICEYFGVIPPSFK